MKHFVATFLCSLAVVAGVKVSTEVRDGFLRKHHDDPISVQSRPPPNTSHPKMSAHEASSKVVWFLGASVDQYAVVQTCKQEGAAIVGDQFRHCHCTFDGVTLVFTFHPGATPPPYYSGTGFGMITKNTHDTVMDQLQEIKMEFGKGPDATIVGSDVWDIANWWQNSGGPQDWPVPHKKIVTWCDTTIPEFLEFVENAVSPGDVALRTPPPAFDTDWKPWGKTLDESTTAQSICLRQKTNNATNLFSGKHYLIDWNQVVKTKAKALGGAMRKWYLDAFHPGPELGRAEVDASLNWVNGR